MGVVIPGLSLAWGLLETAQEIEVFDCSISLQKNETDEVLCFFFLMKKTFSP